MTLWTVASGSSVHGVLQARTLERVAMPAPGMECASPTSPALAGRFFTTKAIWEAQKTSLVFLKCCMWYQNLRAFTVSKEYMNYVKAQISYFRTYFQFSTIPLGWKC